MNNFLTILEFSDVKDSPKVRISLPGPLIVGSKVDLNLVVRRKIGPRTEEFRVRGTYYITNFSFEVMNGLTRQLVTVQALGVAPAWKAIKNRHMETRQVPKAKAPPTDI